VPKQIYTDQTSFVVEGEKFLKQDTLIMVRKHTRFVNFPKHRHNFIEMIYVYNGEMRQKVGDTPIVLKQGELLFLNQYIENSIEESKENDIIINFFIITAIFEFVISFINYVFKLINIVIIFVY